MYAKLTIQVNFQCNVVRQVPGLNAINFRGSLIRENFPNPDSRWQTGSLGSIPIYFR